MTSGTRNNSKKKVLVVYYTQTGQLKKVLDGLISSFADGDNVQVDFFKIELKHQFPFPWNRGEFFGIMPDSVQEVPYELKNHESIPADDYDLVILGYQVWFLSPSVPFNSFLHSPKASELLKNRNVLTVIGGRNMWVMAQESVKNKLTSLGANLIGNVALMDRSKHLVSVVTIIYWLFHGKTNRLLNIFPKPGIQDVDLNKTFKISSEIKNALENNDFGPLQKSIVNLGGVAIKSDIISMETKAKRVFKIWAAIIRLGEKGGKITRIFALLVFEFYLYFVILFLSPLISIFSTFAAIFRRKAIARKMAYYSGV